MSSIRKLSLSLILITLLAWSTLVLAQAAPESGAADFVGPPTAEEAAKAAAATEQKRQNAAEQINVKLQVPLPFVPLTCKDKDGNPAVCKLTDYIAGMYRLLVGLGALLAVVMLIIAGYQWIFAGGSADKIGAAKKRIMGAVMGLMLALLSYVILNSISARLVELRLPLVEPVPPIYWSGAGQACYNSGNDNQELATMEKNNHIEAGKLKVVDLAEGKETARGSTLCGHKYTVPEVGECSGVLCLNASGVETGEACVDDKCQRIFLYGSITNDFDLSNLGEAATGGRKVSKLEVYQVCSLVPNMIDSKDLSYMGRPSKYAFAVRPLEAGRPDLNIDKTCLVSEKGYVLIVSVHRFIGEDDRYYIGKDCKRLQSESGAAWFDMTYLGNVDKALLWQKADFTSQAQICDLDLTNMEQFPKIEGRQ